jgi:cytochrome b561
MRATVHGACLKRYNRGAIALHWIIAALVIGNVALGLSMVPMRISPAKINAYLWHKSIGTSIFLLASLRIVWRLAFGHPAPVPMPPWQARAAAYSHVLLYILLLVIPLSGWLYSSATGVQVLYLGQIPLPDLVPKDKSLADALRRIHVSLNATMAAIVVIHVAAALKHHWIERDESLRRMLPFLRPNDASSR